MPTNAERLGVLEERTKNQGAVLEAIAKDVKEIHNTLHVNGFLDSVNKNTEYRERQESKSDRLIWTIRVGMVSATSAFILLLIEVLLK